MNVDSIVPSEPGWRQVLVKVDEGRPIFKVEPIAGWSVRGNGLVPLAPDGEIYNDYHLVGVVSPICEDSTEDLVAQAMRGVLN